MIVKVFINAGMVRRTILGPMVLFLFLPVIIVGNKMVKVKSRHIVWMCGTFCEVCSKFTSKRPE